MSNQNKLNWYDKEIKKAAKNLSDTIDQCVLHEATTGHISPDAIALIFQASLHISILHVDKIIYEEFISAKSSK